MVGKHHPEEADTAVHLFPILSALQSRFILRPACFSHFHFFTDLENLQAPVNEFKALTLVNTGTC